MEEYLFRRKKTDETIETLTGPRLGARDTRQGQKNSKQEQKVATRKHITVYFRFRRQNSPAMTNFANFGQ